MSNIKIGDVFNKWEVIDPSIPTPANIKNKRPFALCKCLDCGELKPVNIYMIWYGKRFN